MLPIIHLILAGCVVTVSAAGLLAWDNLIVLAKAVETIEIAMTL
jgi:hypothetical protein